MKFRLIDLLILVFAGLVFVAPCAGQAYPAQIAFHLAFGWVWFLGRVLPKASYDPQGIGTALASLALLALGSHLFLRWLRPGWRARWTGTALGLVVLMFLAGTAAVGVLHQAGWLLRSRRPLVVTTGRLRDIAAPMQSANNLKQLGIAAHGFANAGDPPAFPPGGVFDAQGNALHGWMTLLLPYVEQDELHKRMDLAVPWNHPRNASVSRTTVRVYLHPIVADRADKSGFALAHYAANVRLLNAGKGRTLKGIPDGLSSTILAGEAWAAYRPWGHPRNWRDPAAGIHEGRDTFGSPMRPDGAQFAMADGSVKRVGKDISPAVLEALATPDAGDDPGEGW
jgi:hypothetical protein